MLWKESKLGMNSCLQNQEGRDCKPSGLEKQNLRQYPKIVLIDEKVTVLEEKNRKALLRCLLS